MLVPPTGLPSSLEVALHLVFTVAMAFELAQKSGMIAQK